jgi:hypothetical protein
VGQGQDDIGSHEGRGGIDRRKALGLGVAAAGAAWVAPAIISADAASAATGDPEPCIPCGSLTVDLAGCISGPGPLQLTVTPAQGLPQTQFVPTQTPASYQFAGLCAGTATVTLLQDGQHICTSPLPILIECRGQQPPALMVCPC